MPPWGTNTNQGLARPKGVLNPRLGLTSCLPFCTNPLFKVLFKSGHKKKYFSLKALETEELSYLEATLQW